MDLLNNQQINVNHLIFYMHQLLCLIKACEFMDGWWESHPFNY